VRPSLPLHYSRKELGLAEQAVAALLRGERKVLADPARMPLAMVQQLGHQFLRPTPPVGPWPPDEIVALLREFRARGLAEPTSATGDNLPRLVAEVLAVHEEHARRAGEALEQLRAQQRAALAAAGGSRQARPAWRGFEVAVIELAQLHGWRVHHQRPARRANGGWTSAVEGHAGFPDLVLARGPRHGRPGRLILAELKAGRGRVDSEQRQWRDTLVQVHGVEVHVWHQDILEEIAGVLA
jgi:hypothetical protein